MAKRDNRRYVNANTGRPVSDDDVYCMTMLYQYQRLPLPKIARRYGLQTTQVRDLIGRRSGGSCCG